MSTWNLQSQSGLNLKYILENSKNAISIKEKSLRDEPQHRHPQQQHLADTNVRQVQDILDEASRSEDFNSDDDDIQSVTDSVEDVKDDQQDQNKPTLDEEKVE